VNFHFNASLRDADLSRIRVHGLRHTAASLLLAEGIHPKVMQEMLGHGTVTLTLSTYSHVLPSLHRDAATTMDALFPSRRPTDGEREVSRK
jgi:integrase